VTAPERVQSADLPHAPLKSVTRPAHGGRLTALFEQQASSIARAPCRLGLRDGDVDDGLQEVFLVAQSKLDVIEPPWSAVPLVLKPRENVTWSTPVRSACSADAAWTSSSPPLSPPLPARRADRRGERRSGSPGPNLTRIRTRTGASARSTRATTSSRSPAAVPPDLPLPSPAGADTRDVYQASRHAPKSHDTRCECHVIARCACGTRSEQCC